MHSFCCQLLAAAVPAQRGWALGVGGRVVKGLTTARLARGQACALRPDFHPVPLAYPLLQPDRKGGTAAAAVVAAADDAAAAVAAAVDSAAAAVAAPAVVAAVVSAAAVDCAAAGWRACLSQY